VIHIKPDLESHGSISLGTLSRRWEENIETETVCEVVNWIHLAQLRFQWGAIVNLVMNFQVA
jgi:hypothetical protein